MDAVAPAPASPANFMSHVAAQDSAGGDSGHDTHDAIPDTPPGQLPQPGQPKKQIELVKPEQPADDLDGLEPPPEGEAVEEPVDELEPLRALKEELDAGPGLPESLRDRTVAVKINGHMYDVPVAELAQGYQRNADYSRKLGEVKQLEKSVQQTQQGIRTFLNDLRNPETFVEALKELDLYDPFIAAARAEGRRRLQLRELSPDAQQYALQLERERDLRVRQERRAKQLEAQTNELRSQQPNPDQVRLKNQLDQLVPRAFAKHKVGDYALAHELFGKNLDTFYEGGEMTAAIVDAAAQATAEQLADIALRLPKAPANDNGNPTGTLSARRPSAQPGKPLPRTRGGSATDFASYLEKINGGR